MRLFWAISILQCITGLVPKCSFTASTERGQGLFYSTQPFVHFSLLVATNFTTPSLPTACCDKLHYSFTSHCLLRQTSLLLHFPLLVATNFTTPSLPTACCDKLHYSFTSHCLLRQTSLLLHLPLLVATNFTTPSLTLLVQLQLY